MSVARSSRMDGDAPLLVARGDQPEPAEAAPPRAEEGVGAAAAADRREDGLGAARPLVDGEPLAVALDRRDETRAVLVEGEAEPRWRTPILFGPRQRGGPAGTLRRELVVDGWRIEVEIEHARRAELRERARRSGAAAAAGGLVEVRAIIPGKIVAIDVRPGDAVTAGQRVLVLEAMKMQNELAAPREGTVERVVVEPGATVERDELLMVIR